MILTLEVVGEQARHLGGASRKVFHGIGGTIGRLPDNDWVFPDPYISGRHALIRYRGGKYFIEDTSTNGVFVNSRENRVQRDQPYPLRHGDRVYIDAYEIEVSIARDPAKAHEPDPLASLTTRASKSAGAARSGGSAAVPPENRTQKLPARRAQNEADADHETEWFGMTDVTRKLPDHGEPQPAGNARASQPDPDGNAPLRQALEAAGIVDADRQAALIAAMRAAFEATLAQFDPDLLQQEFDGQKSKGSNSGMAAKLRYWELYRERYAQRLEDGDSAFLELFGAAFTKACEEELGHLRTAAERKGQR